MPMPMMTSTSSTLIAAMIPRIRLVVANSPAMDATSERRRLPSGEPRRRRGLTERVVHQLPALAGDAARLLNRRAETHELSREVIERRLHLSADTTPSLGKEEVRGNTTDHRACQCDPHFARVVHLASC